MIRLTVILGCSVLLACDSEPPPPAPAAPVAEGPELALKASEFSIGSTIQGWRFSVRGRRADKAVFKLWRVENGNAHDRTTIMFVDIEDPVEGEVTLLKQSGKPFGQEDRLAFSMDASMERARVRNSVSTGGIVLNGPFQSRLTAVVNDTRPVAGAETILAELRFGKTPGGTLGASNLESLKADSKKEEGVTILAVTVEWD